MLGNYEVHGFEVSAERLPEACTACPFWECAMEADVKTGMCLISGTEIDIDGRQDERRMSDCPITKKGVGALGNEWIDPAERLPELDEEVLAYTEFQLPDAPGERFHRFVLAYIGMLGWRNLAAVLHERVIAWMPLPEPPMAHPKTDESEADS